jgi:hypothetical protein
MEGGVKYNAELSKKLEKQRRKHKLTGMTYRNIKLSAIQSRMGISTKRFKKTVKQPIKLKLKKTVEELIASEMEPNLFLKKSVDLIKLLLKKTNTTKDRKKVDNMVIALVNALYYSLRKESNINYNSDATSINTTNENDIWNDPYTLLKTLTRKLEELLTTEDEELKLELSETIKSALKYGYDQIYVKHKNVEVDELSELFSKL